MKLVKGISFFVLYPLLLLTLGFYTGVKASHYFYSDARNQGDSLVSEEMSSGAEAILESVGKEDKGYETTEPRPFMDADYDVVSGNGRSNEEAEDVAEVLFSAETLCVDTQYVLEETDILNQTTVETTWRLPSKYVGMNREQFLQAMDIYAMSPPLSELERGFIGLEVLSFSRERVVVRMDYKFVQPSSSFYLAVYDNEVVVYLEDMETVYIETDIDLDSLPEQLKQDIMGMLWIEDEEALYDFLENYSS